MNVAEMWRAFNVLYDYKSGFMFELYIVPG